MWICQYLRSSSRLRLPILIFHKTTQRAHQHCSESTVLVKKGKHWQPWTLVTWQLPRHAVQMMLAPHPKTKGWTKPYTHHLTNNSVHDIQRPMMFRYFLTGVVLFESAFLAPASSPPPMLFLSPEFTSVLVPSWKHKTRLNYEHKSKQPGFLFFKMTHHNLADPLGKCDKNKTTQTVNRPRHYATNTFFSPYDTKCFKIII